MTAPVAPGDRSQRIADLLDSWTDVAAVVADRHLTVIGANDLAVSLTPAFSPGENLARFTFLHPSFDPAVGRWAEMGGQVAAMLRESHEQSDDDHLFQRVIGELSANSRAFSVLWADESTSALRAGTAGFPDAAQGAVTLAYTVFEVPGDDHETLIVLGSTAA